MLAHEVEIDLRDKDGNTALHIAIEKKLIPIVQCLVVFGCDIDARNKHEQSSRHMVGKNASGSDDDMILYILHSVGAKRCPETSSKCPPGCNFKEYYNGIPPAQPETSEQREAIQQVLASGTSQHARGRNSLPSLHQLSRFPREEPTLIDTSAEQKGASVMDALLGMFTSKIQAAAKKETSLTDKSTSTQEDEEEEKMQYEDEASASEEDPETPIGRGRVLCLDGGGIRGLVLVQILLELEQLAQCPINHLFDWVSYIYRILFQSLLECLKLGRRNLNWRHISTRNRSRKNNEAVHVLIFEDEGLGFCWLSPLSKRSVGKRSKGKPR